MALVKYGGMAATFTDPRKTPWFWSQVVQIWTRIQSIKEAAAYDPEKLAAPKDLWLDSTGLDDWFKEREAKAREPKTLD